ncbi:putative F-box/LRR-repeat protein At3g28410 [Lactuca sativa]|uniref:putative F-box/LRR-repeat protein At3g28410 n=1 Tax=Lactuca sativa TaxID=4236 RepID=UPI000CD80C4B|nr:putative F-box/LRR-repeat protein At3g28410 [Lactuca sativa]
MVEERNQPKMDAKAKRMKFQETVGKGEEDRISVLPDSLNLEIISRLPSIKSAVRTDKLFCNNSSFTDLNLDSCIFNSIGAISWKNLRSLFISNGKLDDDSIENILSGSPLLETLELYDCYGYSRLDITSKTVKNLVLDGYIVPEDYNDAGNFTNIVTINAPNILSLTIHGELLLWKVLLVNVSSLIEANLDYTRTRQYKTSLYEADEDMLKGFILNLRHVKELKIGELCSKVFFHLRAKGFIFPSNVKLMVY